MVSAPRPATGIAGNESSHQAHTTESASVGCSLRSASQTTVVHKGCRLAAIAPAPRHAIHFLLFILTLQVFGQGPQFIPRFATRRSAHQARQESVSSAFD